MTTVARGDHADMLRPQTKLHTKITTLVEHLAPYKPIAHGDLTQTVSGISMNSKTIEPGDLYAAVGGAQHHGADYIDEGLAAGAVAVLTDPSGLHRIPENIPRVVVDDVRGALADAAALIYDNTGVVAPQMYGVTGTNGKTTTTYFLNAILDALGHTTGLIGTIETRIAGVSDTSEFTTPEAPELHSLIARMREAEVTAASMEVSSHAMAYKRAYGLMYGVVGFTNLTQDHLDLHGDMHEYYQAKAALFADEHSTVQVITLNGGAEPHWGGKLAESVSGAVTLDLGPAALTEVSSGSATWRITQIEPAGLGHQFTLQHASGLSVTTRVGMPGEFNIANAALAAVMVYAGHERHHWDHITAVLERQAKAPFESAVPGRMEVISKTPTVVVDFAHNPDGLTQALQAVNRSSHQQHGTQARTIVIFGATGQRDTAKRPLMGRIAAEHADVVIITDDDPHHEDPAQIRQAVLSGARAAAATQNVETEILEIAPRAEALVKAVELAGPTDTILAAGRGHETHQDLAGEAFAIDDRQVLHQALIDHGFITTGSASPHSAD